MKIKWILTGLVALTAAVVVAGVAILATMDFEELRGIIEAEAEKATGRKLTVAGSIDLSLSLTPAISVEDIRFANADWGSRPEMVTIRRLEIEVAILPLFSGEIQVKRLVVVAPDILLETDAQGRGNWEIAGAGDGQASQGAGGGMPLPSFDNVVVRDAILTYRDGKTGEITQRLQRLFFDAIRGKNDKYSHWLTPVKPQTSGQPADRQGVKAERVP
ncbi:MAG: AsmA family protein [Chloroflexi bacterium]|nr:AsmA family protein [Chloroflexota bacterium]